MNFKKVSLVHLQGARHHNEDRFFVSESEKLVGVFDGHSGSGVAEFASAEFSRRFSQQDCEVVGPVLALTRTIEEIQNAIPHREMSGSTAIVAHADGDTISVCCLGDSSAIVFDDKTGAILPSNGENTQVWDVCCDKKKQSWPDVLVEQDKLPGRGMRHPSGLMQTVAHAFSGPLVSDQVGSREFSLLLANTRNRERTCLLPPPPKQIEGSIPQENRWRVGMIEPSRSLGDIRAPYCLHGPEITQWSSIPSSSSVLLLCSDGFTSKNAFLSLAHLARFLTDPLAFLARWTLDNTVLVSHDPDLNNDLQQVVDIPDRIRLVASRALAVLQKNEVDQHWIDTHCASARWLQDHCPAFSGSELLAAAHLAILQLSDDNLTAVALKME
jgi:serine/threonine protein phosphatase PrpC